jgi:hypothetical protein
MLTPCCVLSLLPALVIFRSPSIPDNLCAGQLKYFVFLLNLEEGYDWGLTNVILDDSFLQFDEALYLFILLFSMMLGCFGRIRIKI